MGLNTDLVRNKNILDRETIEYLSTRSELSDAIVELALDLRRIERNPQESSSVERKIKMVVKNHKGEELIINVIGINANSLVSSEISGQVAFTFIQEISELKKIKNESARRGNLRLIKLC